MQAEAVNRPLVKFMWAALIFFAWSLIQGVIQGAIPSVRALTMEAGPGAMIGSAHTHVGLMGWLALGLMAAIYYLVPILSGKAIVWPKLIEWVFWIFVVCTAVDNALKIIGGIAGSIAYATPAGILCTLSVIAGLMFVVQVLVSLSRSSEAVS